ncbi:MAG TPA: tetratricopeptide repeat protein, partial [Candidatus Solibacter sp.]|nr:tetratricopeptide repeat protein [Candidatus Solibacter sp.]
DNVMALNNLAFLLADTGGNLEDAMSMIRKALKSSGEMPGTLDTLGWIYFKQHALDSAAQVFASLTRKYPANPTCHYHLALAMLGKGDRAQAKTELQVALANNPSTQEVTEIRKALAGL